MSSTSLHSFAREVSITRQRLFALSGLVLLTIQVAVGAFDALLGSPAALADVHLALASALWAVVVAVVALSARGTRATTALVGSRDVERAVLATAGT